MQAHRIDATAAMYLLALVSTYDSGQHLIGLEQPRRWIGPIAGLAGVAVVAVAMMPIAPRPLTSAGSVLVVGAFTGLAAVVGPYLASAMLPRPLTKAPALRRLDSYLIAAPLFWCALRIAS
ncbi:MAG: hypothetical protein R2698_05525 [Microthrixaceae bacterium]